MVGSAVSVSPEANSSSGGTCAQNSGVEVGRTRVGTWTYDGKKVLALEKSFEYLDLNAVGKYFVVTRYIKVNLWASNVYIVLRLLGYLVRIHSFTHRPFLTQLGTHFPFTTGLPSQIDQTAVSVATTLASRRWNPPTEATAFWSSAILFWSPTGSAELASSVQSRNSLV